MPARINLNGNRLPIGTSTNSGDTDEESDIEPEPGMQWTDQEWQAYQDQHCGRSLEKPPVGGTSAFVKARIDEKTEGSKRALRVRWP